MDKTRLFALSLAAVLAGVAVLPTATYALEDVIDEPTTVQAETDGEVGEPPLPDDGDDEGEVGEPPLPDDGEDEGADGPSVSDPEVPDIDFEALRAEAEASIAGLDKRSVLKAATEAVDEQIENWNVWKYVPYAMGQVKYGYGCGFDDSSVTEGIWLECRRTGYTASTLIILQLIPLGENVSVFDDEYWSQPEVKALTEMSLSELIEYTKTQPEYANNVNLQDLVKRAEEGYENGAVYIKKAAKELLDLQEDDTRTVEKLIEVLLTLSEAKAYGITEQMNENDGLFWNYSRAYMLAYDDNFMNADDAEKTSAYANLVVAATKVNPEFEVNLGSVPVLQPTPTVPTAPNTGDTEDVELSGTIAKIALTGVAGLAAIAGAIITVKRYAFSPLKRK